MFTPANTIAALLALAPYVIAAFFPQWAAGRARSLPAWAQLASPAALCLPYALVACAGGNFRWEWLLLYAVLPVAIATLLRHSENCGWRGFLVLAVLGLAVDLRWFEGAWPAHLAIFNKVLLLDAGIYGFIALRQLEGTGFDLRLRIRDAATGLRELALYTPIALALGLSLGFLHLHASWPGIEPMASAWVFTFFFIAVPEELFFRGWLQNLLERRIGRTPALLLTAVLFGLSHFNKRAAYFNWRYVLLAAVAGVFYGRAWRRDRRVGAAAITHASVDAIWSLWLR
ncbi:MAG: type II CAAX endopeptidase family protein [Terracidiphilus sp.]|jgi:membrane protease YdiL (CAAX protease family)